MADTTTINDLTEKQTLVDTDKILVEDTNGVGQALLGSAITDKINGALADYTKIVKVNVSDTTLDTLKTALLDNIATLNNGDIIHIYRDTQKRAILILNKPSNIYFDVAITSYYYTENELRYNNGTWQDSYVLNNALASQYKIKEVTATSSANGNIDLGLNGYDNIILSIQSYNSSGFNNDTMIIPYKLGDGKPQGSSSGRWGAHCCTSNSTMTVKANETIYCTVCYVEKSH